MAFHSETVHREPNYEEYTQGGQAFVNGKPRSLCFILFQDQESPEASAWLKGYDQMKFAKEQKLGGKLKE